MTTSIWMRPERAAVGRPAQRSRAGITAAAVGIADREGLDAVSMRRVAAELGTGAASLYRYVETREDLLDLMTDAVGGEYLLPEPSADWLADLVAFGEQSRTIMLRHPWVAGLIVTRPVLGPNGIAMLEAFATLNGICALFVQHELAGGSALHNRNVAYLQHAVASGKHPRLTRLLTQDAAATAAAGAYDPADTYGYLLARILTGLLDGAPGRPG